MKLRQAIEVIKDLRNATAHSTPDECDKFMNGQWTFPDFPFNPDWISLWMLLDKAVSECLDFINANLLTSKRDELLENMQLTKKTSVKFLAQYFAKKISHQQEFIAEQLLLHETLSSMKHYMDAVEQQLASTVDSQDCIKNKLEDVSKEIMKISDSASNVVTSMYALDENAKKHHDDCGMQFNKVLTSQDVIKAQIGNINKKFETLNDIEDSVLAHQETVAKC